MVKEFEACAECMQRCLLVHGDKKSGSHIGTSFFKIMFGKQFSKFMELPPKVARRVLLSDRRTSIEDLSGQRWNVGISAVNGSLAFQQGWNAFALDHDLQVGDILVFNYIVGSHFTVKIYDNSGCELNLSAIVKSTMRKSGLDTVSGQHIEINKCVKEVSGMKKPLIITENASAHDDDDNNERSNCKRKANFADGMSCMMEREYGHQQGENRAHILDFSSVESFKKIRTCGSDGTNKVTVVNEPPSYQANSSLRLRSEVGSVKIPVAKEVANRVIPIDAAEHERTEKNNYSEYKVKGASLSDKDSSTNVASGDLLPTLPDNPQENDEIVSDIMIRAVQKFQSASASGNDNHLAVSGQKSDLIDDTCQSANKKSTGISNSCDKVMTVTEDEPVELTSHPCSQEVIPESNDDAMMIIEKEFVDSPDQFREEVIAEIKDKATTIFENVIVDLTLDQSKDEVIEKEKLLDFSTKVDKQSSYSQPRAVPPDPVVFKRTEEYSKSEAEVNKVPVDKNSCSETSEHPIPIHSENLETNGETIPATSKTTSDGLKEPTKEYQNADGSELSSDNNQVSLSQKEPDLTYHNIPRDNKKLTGTTESIHKPITSEGQKNYDTTINDKGSVVVTCQEAIPQRNDTIINEKETVKVNIAPSSQEIVPERKETIVIEDESTQVTLDPSCQEVIPERKGQSFNYKPYVRLHKKCADTNIRAAPSDADDLERTNNSNYSEVKVRKVSASDKFSHTNQTSCHRNPIRPVHVEEDKTNTPKTSNREINKLKTADRSGNVQVGVSQKEPVLIDDSCLQAKKKFSGETPVTFGFQDYSAKSSKISNKLQSQSNFAREKGTIPPVVKTEPVEDAVATFPSFTISCFAPDRLSFLELPKSLPFEKVTKGRHKFDRRIVYFQGADKRSWPVLYIQKFFFRTLTTGWEAFCMANNIEQGDRCTIEVTNQAENICTVQVVKMSDDMEFYEECARQPIINL